MKHLIILLASVIALAGCKVTENQVRSYPQLARVCADEYPIKTVTLVTERVKYDTITLPGGQVVIRDTIPCPDGSRVPVEYDQPCPPVKVVTRTVYRDSLVQVENTAHVRALQADSTSLTNQVSAAITRGDKWQKWALYALGAAALLAGWIFRSPILSMVKKLIA